MGPAGQQMAKLLAGKTGKCSFFPELTREGGVSRLRTGQNGRYGHAHHLAPSHWPRPLSQPETLLTLTLS